MSNISSNAQPARPMLATTQSTNPGAWAFTLSGINVSIANSIRRTILSDIDIVVIRTTPHNKNNVVVGTNTTRMNNEILGQRLSCIPIHLAPNADEISKLILEVDIENLTNTTLLVTTEHFKIKHADTGEYLSDDAVHDIFPPNAITGDYIDLIELRPKITNAMVGGHIQFTATFSIASAEENSMFNVVSTCSYANTPDTRTINILSSAKLKDLAEDETQTPDERRTEHHNWVVLDSARIFLPDSFDFVIETICPFENKKLVLLACESLINRLARIRTQIAGGNLNIRESSTTMKNCYDIVLENEGHTLGKALEFIMYKNFYANSETPTSMTFCGFQKAHPHDVNSIIRVAYKTEQSPSTVLQNVLHCATELMNLYGDIQGLIT